MPCGRRDSHPFDRSARAHASESRAPPQALVHEYLLIMPAAYEASGDTLDTTGASNVAHAYGAGVCNPTGEENGDQVRSA